ncbi:type II toxin-antitoxin system RelE/ParE family toxin [Methylobacterium tarhaniae]|uniref:type II toxin-antitoxin system RelE/ParE family toxin n=1 Tax=Methylobacterium tarhaniae TaxID=1187852 RepID=UPI003D00B03F
MKIRNVKHKGLRRLLEKDDAAGLPAAVVDKVRKILFFLQSMETEDELAALPSWKPHQFQHGERKGLWSLHVTKNWRITFMIDQGEIEIYDLDYEDYH